MYHGKIIILLWLMDTDTVGVFWICGHCSGHCCGHCSGHCSGNGGNGFLALASIVDSYSIVKFFLGGVFFGGCPPLWTCGARRQDLISFFSSIPNDEKLMISQT